MDRFYKGENHKRREAGREHFATEVDGDPVQRPPLGLGYRDGSCECERHPFTIGSANLRDRDHHWVVRREGRATAGGKVDHGDARVAGVVKHGDVNDDDTGAVDERSLCTEVVAL